jgi:hypothetical protein
MRINTPKNINSLRSEEKESWEDAQTSLDKIASIFDVKSTSKPLLRNFSLFSSKVDPKIYDSWTIKGSDNKFNLCLVEYRYIFSTAGPVGGYIHSDLSLYLYGHLPLKKSFGNTIIRPESIADKVLDLYLKLDIDNPDYPKFSRNFYVTSDNKDALIKNFPSEFYNLLETNEDVQIEFKNNSCLFRLSKSVNSKDALRLSEIGLRLDKILNDT